MGLAYETLYFIYYEDLTLAGGAVTYHATTSKATAMASGAAFFVGSIRTPKAGAFDTVGNNDGGTAASLTGMITRFRFSTQSNVGAIANPDNANDGDQSTKATLTVNGTGSINNAQIELQHVPAVTRRFSTLKMKIIWAIPTNTLNGSGLRAQILFVGAGVTLDTITINAGVTQALQLSEVDIPVNSNPNDYEITIQCFGTTGSTSGTLNFDVYDAWVEGTE
jgi:hypothetical protein